MKKIYKLVPGILLSLMVPVISAAQSWSPRTNFGAAGTYSSFSFTIGSFGYTGTGNIGSTTNLTDTFWQYDPATDSWTQKANFPGAPRYEAIGFAIGTKGYAGTGLVSSTTQTTNDFYEYDPAANAWTNKANLPSTLNCASAFVIGTKGYVVTGDLSANNSSTATAQMWEYDPALDTWTVKAALPGAPRTRAFAFAINNKGYVGGGTNDGSNNLSDFWEYDPASNSWTQRGNLPLAVRLPIAFSIGSKGFLGTGYTTTTIDSFYEYDPALDSWTQRPAFGGTVRWGAASFAIGNQGFVGNGRSGSNTLSDWWVYDSGVGIEEENANTKVVIYPNPISATAQLSITGLNNSHAVFEMFDMAGKRVKVIDVDGAGAVLSREGLSSGMYTYRLVSNNKVVASGKLLIQ